MLSRRKKPSAIKTEESYSKKDHFRRISSLSSLESKTPIIQTSSSEEEKSRPPSSFELGTPAELLSLSFKQLESLKASFITLINILFGIPKEKIDLTKIINERELFDRVSTTVISYSRDDFSYFREWELAYEILHYLLKKGLNLTSLLHEMGLFTEKKSIVIKLQGSMYYTDQYAKEEYGKRRIPGAASKERKQVLGKYRLSRIEERAKDKPIIALLPDDKKELKVEKIAAAKSPSKESTLYSGSTGEVTLLFIRRVASDTSAIQLAEGKIEGSATQLFIVMPYTNTNGQLCFDDPAYDERIAELESHITTIEHLLTEPTSTTRTSSLQEFSKEDLRKELERNKELQKKLQRQIIIEPDKWLSADTKEAVPIKQGYMRCGLFLKILESKNSHKIYDIVTRPPQRPPFSRGATTGHIKPRTKIELNELDGLKKMFDDAERDAFIADTVDSILTQTDTIIGRADKLKRRIEERHKRSVIHAWRDAIQQEKEEEENLSAIGTMFKTAEKSSSKKQKQQPEQQMVLGGVFRGWVRPPSKEVEVSATKSRWGCCKRK